MPDPTTTGPDRCAGATAIGPGAGQSLAVDRVVNRPGHGAGGFERALLENVLDLTAQTDVLSLNEAMLRHVRDLLSGVAVRIYERPAAGLDWRVVATRDESGACTRVTPEQRAQDLRRVHELLEDSTIPSLYVPDAGAGHSCLLLPVRKGSVTLTVVIIDALRSAQRAVDIAPMVQGFSNLFVTLYRGSHDPLTGLLNRQTFDERMSAVMEAAHREVQACTDTPGSYFVIMDIDHFKKVNDTYGHLMGDEVLLRFAQLMLQRFRSEDLLFRFGGEEFVVVLDHVTADIAAMVLERFRATVAEAEFPGAGHITCSIGFSRLDLQASLEIISERADKALYYAKERGRNQVRCFETLRDAGELVDDLHESPDVNLF